MNSDLPPADSSDTEPNDPDPTDHDPTTADPDDASDLDDVPYDDVPCTDDGDDDPRWEAFIADEDECDPWPDPGDFWLEGRQENETATLADKLIDHTIRCLHGCFSPSIGCPSPCLVV
jgi:hypothetical protein